MGVMNRLRESTGVILWILVFAFGVIWVLQDSGGLDVVGVLSNNVGTVNGEPISFEEYSRALDTQVQNYQEQNGESMPPQMLDQTRNAVFDQLVELKLREQELERLGLQVSDQEVVDMVQGENPHPIIRLYFGDGQGGVDRALLQSVIENPEARADWLNIENYLRSERLREKLDNLITAGFHVSDADVEGEYLRRSRTVDVSFVALRFASIPNDSVQVTDSDLRAFYDRNREDFARKRSYTFRYASEAKSPTPEDTAHVLDDLEGMRDAFAAAESDSTYLVRNGSSTAYADAYFRPDELDPAVSDVVFDNPVPGTVVGPVIGGGFAHLVKIIDVRAPEETAVRARHILFRAADNDPAARQEAETQAREVLQRIRAGEDFAEMARTYSSDGTAANGGDLGWFGPGRMVEPFEEAAFAARVGQPVGPVATQFGFHLIEVTERATVEAKVADFTLPLQPSVATLNRIQEQLDDLQYFSTENGDFSGEAQRRGLEVTTVEIEEEQDFIPGIGASTTLVNFLAGAEAGSVSPVIELDTRFIVGVVDAVQPAGYRPLEEVRSQIEPRVRNEKKAAQLKARLQAAAASSSDLEGIAQAVGTPVATANSLSFQNLVVPTLGRDPGFVGAALGLAEGSLSGVIEGTSAVYVIRADQVTEPAPISDAQRAALRNQILAQGRDRLRTQWITDLREKAEIVDNRRALLVQ
jgi:peptidylprolyl isomerase/peptidyl-prolyl cis-trans isomerase D